MWEVIMDGLIVQTKKTHTAKLIFSEGITQKWIENIPQEIPALQRITIYGKYNFLLKTGDFV